MPDNFLLLLSQKLLLVYKVHVLVETITRPKTHLSYTNYGMKNVYTHITYG